MRRCISYRVEKPWFRAENRSCLGPSESAIGMHLISGYFAIPLPLFETSAS